MKIEDNIELHSHYIEELFDSQEKRDTTIEMIRARTHEMKETIGMLTYATESLSGEIMKILENYKDIVKINNETVKMNHETRELIDKINLDTYRRFQPIEFIREILGSPRVYMLLIIFLVTLAFTVEAVISGFAILKHIFPILGGN